MLTHYVDLVPRTGPVLYSLYGRVLMAAHLTARDGQGIAIDWPMWKDMPGCFGHVIRLLGTQGAIDQCLDYLAPLIAAGLVAGQGDPKAVPDGAVYLHGYRRNRKPDKGSPSHLRRLERRAESRASTYDSSGAQWVQAKHKLPMQSSSTGQNFHLFIERVPADKLTGASVGSYGLGVLVPHF